MEQAALQLDGINESARAGTTELVRAALAVFAERLRGLTVFGTAATADFEPRHRVRSVLTLDCIDIPALAQLAQDGPRLGKLHVEAPLIVTPEYVRRSLDAFPLEFLEIHQTRCTVFGDDTFAAIEPHPEHLRLQCERELKRLMIRLRQGLLAGETTPDYLAALLEDLRRHAERILCGFLWLRGDRLPLTTRQVWDRASGALDMPLADLRPPTAAESASIDNVQRFYACLEKLAERADAHQC
jgi:hypothetical protein